mmetsp:Transcript_14041/g.34308  ORF Transcript_14041/g.34308 Transcript_14041/m.34308 type:complete len:778 (-) Transcript_14041:634-2967(-)
MLCTHGLLTCLRFSGPPRGARGRARGAPALEAPEPLPGTKNIRRLGGSERHVVLLHVANLLQVRDARKVDHRRWPAHANERVGARGGGKVLLDHDVADEAHAVLPLWLPLGHAVDGVVALEPRGVVTCPPVEVLAKQDVGGGLVGIEEHHLSLVLIVLENLPHHLVRGRDARSPADEPDLLGAPLVLAHHELPLAQVREVPKRPLHLDRVADGEAVEVLRHLAPVGEARVHVGEVDLDDELEVAHVVVAARGRVGAHARRAVDVGDDEHVVAAGQAEHVLVALQREAEAPRVVRELFLLDKRHLDLLLGIQRHRRRFPHLGRGRGQGGLLHDPPGRGARGHVAELADVKVFEHLAGLVAVHSVKVLGGVHPAVHRDARSTPRVLLEEGCRVVDLAIDHDPAVVLGRVLLHLSHGDDPRPLGRSLGDGRHARHDLHRGVGLGPALEHRERAVGRVACHALDPLPPTRGGLLEGNRLGPKGELLLRLHHPAARPGAGDRGLLEPDADAANRVLRCLGGMDLDGEDVVVAHAHDVPRLEVCLRVVTVVPRAAPHVLVGARQQQRDRRLVLPVAPAPVAPPLRVGHVVKLRKIPCIPAVERQLHARHLPPAARVRVALHRVGLGRGVEGYHLAVAWRGDDAVDVELVEEVLWLVPPPLLVRPFLVHLGRKDAVIEEVIVVVRLLLSHLDLCEPLDHAPADPARDDEPAGVPVVGHEALASLLIGDDDVPEGIHGVGRCHARAVVAVGQLVRTHEAHILRSLPVSLDARLLQDVAQRHALPD